MDIPHQIAGVLIGRVVRGGGGGNGQEVALLLRGNAPLVSQLVGDVGRQQTDRAVHVQAGFPGVGAVKTGEVHGGEEAGEKHPLGHPVLPLQKGEAAGEIVVDRRAGGEDLVPRDGKQAVPVPGHLVRRLLKARDEQGRHPLQRLRRHGLGADAALLLKAVGVVVHPPAHTVEPPGRQA